MTEDPMYEVPLSRLREVSEQAQRASDLERENNELREIVAALVIKHVQQTRGVGGLRTVLNPDVLGAVDSSLLLIDQSIPGMVVIRYGS